MKSKITQFKLWNQFIIASVILTLIVSNKVFGQSNPAVNTLEIGSGGIISESGVDLKIQSNGCHQYNTIINGQGGQAVMGLVGIGTFDPIKKLHIRTESGNLSVLTNCGGGSTLRSGSQSTNGLRLEDVFITQSFSTVSATWDIEPVIGASSNDPSSLYIGTPNSPKLAILDNGKIGIGITNPAYELDVCGTIRSKEVRVNLTGCDFVFEKNYKLMPLKELAIYVEKYKHLPEIAPAKDMETKDGVLVGEMQSKLLQKVEELTLYMIELQKENEEMRAEIKSLKQK